MNIPLKPGVSTTEFWTVIVCGLLLTAQAALSLTTVAWAASGVTLLSLLYVHQRGKLKSIAAKMAAEKLKDSDNSPQ
jgi:hypothetical protein